jgi:hypothetical protein
MKSCAGPPEERPAQCEESASCAARNRFADNRAGGKRQKGSGGIVGEMLQDIELEQAVMARRSE